MCFSRADSGGQVLGQFFGVLLRHEMPVLAGAGASSISLMSGLQRAPVFEFDVERLELHDRLAKSLFVVAKVQGDQFIGCGLGESVFGPSLDLDQQLPSCRCHLQKALAKRLQLLSDLVAGFKFSTQVAFIVD